MQTSEVIKKLEKLVNDNGDCPFNIYLSFSEKTIAVLENDIAFDDAEKDIYIGIYN